MGIVNELNLFPVFFQQEEWEIPGNKNLEEIETGLTPSASSGDYYIVRITLNAFSMFSKSLAKATILLPLLLSEFKVPSALNVAITSIVWLVYVIGMIQFVSGRSIEAIT